jgi:hypothetical protein
MVTLNPLRSTSMDAMEVDSQEDSPGGSLQLGDGHTRRRTCSAQARMEHDMGGSSREVRFDTRVRVVLVPSRSEMALLDRSLLWWESRDYAEFRERFLNFLELSSSSTSCEVEVRSSSSSSSAGSLPSSALPSSSLLAPPPLLHTHHDIKPVCGGGKMLIPAANLSPPLEARNHVALGDQPTIRWHYGINPVEGEYNLQCGAASS